MARLSPQERIWRERLIDLPELLEQKTVAERILGKSREVAKRWLQDVDYVQTNGTKVMYIKDSVIRKLAGATYERS